MYIEKRDMENGTKYYLAHSFRYAGKVKKVRYYLGMNLTEEEIEEKRPKAEKVLRKRIKARTTVHDPLRTVLTPEEKSEIETLTASFDFDVIHLSEEEWRKFTAEFAYDTNAIEGSTVTQSEVEDILEREQWPPARTKDEISETYGVAEAINHIRSTDEHISLQLMKDLHSIVFKNSLSFAGRFREKEVAIVDAREEIIHRGAPPTQVAPLLKELVEWYEENKENYSPLVLAMVVHNQFETIHPFEDGNGRVGRLLLNNILLKHNFPPVNIGLENRREYYATLHEYQENHNIRPTIELILKEYRRLKKTLEK